MTDLQKKLFVAFDSEYRTILETIRAFVGVVESSGEAPQPAALNEAFRMAHTLKGSAQIVGFPTIVTVAHRLESMFAKIRDGFVQLKTPEIRVVHAAVDMIEDVVAAARVGTPAPDVQGVVTQIESILNGQNSLQSSHQGNQVSASPLAEKTPEKSLQAPPEKLVAVSATAEAKPVVSALEKFDAGQPSVAASTGAASVSSATPLNAPAPSAPLAAVETVRLNASHLDQLLGTTGELLSVIRGGRQMESNIAQVGGHLDSLVREWELVRRTSAGAIQKMSQQPEFARISQFLELLGNELLPMAKQTHLTRELNKQKEWNLRHLTERLQEDVRKARTVAAETIFGGFNKMVRDLASELNRPVDFRCTGLDVEADRIVLQALKDPLMHILRNAIGHGIEAKEIRAARGKDATGKISVRITASSGRLNIAIEDDGQGLDKSKILDRARAQNLISEMDAESISTDDLHQLIFQPGFSTAAEVSNLSGRGIGMSVVSDTVHRLQGQIKIDNSPGEKLIFTISVPVALTNHRLVLVQHDEQVYALPSGSVDSLQRVKRSAFTIVEGRWTYSIEGAPVPVVHIGSLFGVGSHSVMDFSTEIVPLVVLRSKGQRVAVAVEQILDECEAIIKNLGAPFSDRQIFSGAVFQGDGQLALVLDSNAIFDHAIRQNRDAHVSAPVQKTKSKIKKSSLKILVVDDSITTRTLEKGILESNGHQVSLAVDGMDALNCLQVDQFDLVISDVEMPRMNGFTLVSEIRKHPKFSKVPIIMVTSLEKTEDQQRGLSLGANAYVLKQKFDQGSLLETIKQVVA